MPSHDLERMLDFSAEGAAKSSGAGNPQRLAAALAIDHSCRLQALLKEFEDSYLGQSMTGFLDMGLSLGFQIIQKAEFYNNGPAVFATMERKGLLICADSYQGMVNQAQLLCRCKQELTGGQACEGGWRGAIDVRQGLKFRLGHHQLQPAQWEEDFSLLAPSLAQKVNPRLWPRSSRRRVGAKK